PADLGYFPAGHILRQARVAALSALPDPPRRRCSPFPEDPQMATWKWLGAALTVGTVTLGLPGPANSAPRHSSPDQARPRVEVVFCLDTTGSMSGLIDGAKQKIWSLCNQIVGGKPTPQLKVGVVAYRDRGDEYVTKVFDLNDNLDAIHGHLMSFKA